MLEQLDYRKKFSEQFPAPDHRVVYAASGMHVAAARVDDPRAVIEHSLYWAGAGSEDEADYLVAILNTPIVTGQVRPLMSYGKDERHVDKYVWQLPIPSYDPREPLHLELVELSRTAAEEVAQLDIPPTLHFPTARRAIRRHLANSDVGATIERIAVEMVGVADPLDS